MSSFILDSLLGDGLEAFDDSAAAPVTATPDGTPAAVPSVDVTVCEEEIAVVEAATDAVKAEAQLIDTIVEVEATEVLLDAQTELVVETSAVVASMESFIGAPMSKQDALVLAMRVTQATRGQYVGTRVVGSVESFGTDIATDDAMNAGLEGIGEFLEAARNKLSGITAVMRAKVSAFFKDAFVNFSKVSQRAAAVERLAKGTTGESNSSAIQLPLDTAWQLVRDGKVVTNFAKEVADLAKMAEVIMKDTTEELAADRRKFIELVSPLATADLDTARGIAKKIVDWKMPKPGYAKVKLQTPSRTTDVFRSEVLMGDQAIFVSVPLDMSSPNDSLNTRLDKIYGAYRVLDVATREVGKKPNKLDLALDTLKPAEIVKITEAVQAVLGDIKVYSKSWNAWDEANTDLDRLMNILVNVEYEGDDETYEGTVTTQYGSTVYTNKLNYRLADSVWYVNAAYGYMSTQPIIQVAKRLIVVLNRILEVCERSLATYSDNNLK
ncbi:hypothetical protein pEaSNUABM37_00334 [Erwinia phage pEa_SNUABM_37]|nr:hypothetical protein pEaSNUABM37_00334 [Erwinia phage pEa_SNUABM_37]QXO10802.1 hypothetical protein pEaSNUABM48_00334 [Erwinia phage pEa_SNUABM_48]